MWRSVLCASQFSYFLCSRNRAPNSRHKFVWPAQCCLSLTRWLYHGSFSLGLSKLRCVLRDLGLKCRVYARFPFPKWFFPQSAFFNREFALGLKLLFPRESRHNLFFFDVSRRWARFLNRWSSVSMSRCHPVQGRAIFTFHQCLLMWQPCAPSSRSEVVCATPS